MSEIRVPVLIVGGGGAGLSASMLLSSYGVSSLLVSAAPSTSRLPKAHLLNQRTMEIFRELGLAERVYAGGCPPQNMSHVAWYRGIAGEDPDAGRLIAKLESWGAGYTDPAWVAASPCPSTNLPQLRLEPIMRERAEELNPGGVRFHHEALSIEHDADGASVRVLDRDAGSEYTIRADYVLGCDGGRTIGRQIGVELEGQRDVARVVTLHMTADLSHLLRDEDVLIRWIVHPGTSHELSVLLPMGPTNWGTRSEEWVFGMNYAVSEAHLFDDDEKILASMRKRMGLPDFDPEVHAVTRWSMEGLLAPQMQVGRILLVGDAAHRHPPTGGLGLNSAVQDAYNLCWKLALVVRGLAGPELLESYDPERRPVLRRNVDRSLENARNQAVVLAAIGIDPSSSSAENRERTRLFWEPGADGERLRERAFAGIATASMEFNEHNVEFGFTYESAAVIPDGSPALQSVDEIRVYEPSTRPGAPLPHAWVERAGVRMALREVAGPASFMLIAGEDGEPWCEAARAAAAARGVELMALRVGLLEGDYLDPRSAFTRQREFARDGAILVRPDRVVAWRSMSGAPDPTGILDRALARLLAETAPA